MTSGELEDILHKEGWPLERLDETTWRSAFDSLDGPQRFFVRLTETWIFFTVAPYVPPARSVARRLRLFQRCLELNREMNLAKLALDADGDMVLTVELPTHHLEPEEIENALSALSYYAERHQAELRGLMG